MIRNISTGSSLLLFHMKRGDLTRKTARSVSLEIEECSEKTTLSIPSLFGTDGQHPVGKKIERFFTHQTFTDVTLNCQRKNFKSDQVS